jgi:hypothetical protein
MEFYLTFPATSLARTLATQRAREVSYPTGHVSFFGESVQASELSPGFFGWRGKASSLLATFFTERCNDSGRFGRFFGGDVFRASMAFFFFASGGDVSSGGDGFSGGTCGMKTCSPKQS